MAQTQPKQQAPTFPSAVLRKFPPEERSLIGVSGGRDSVALLHWLLSLGYRKLIVCHLDHQLRGRSARADAQFVARLAEKNECSFELGRADVAALAAKERLSMETAARQARYQFFARIARRRRCRTIFLGHHADDLVETFLINLFRGTGLRGLQSMRPVSLHHDGKLELQVVRPLLDVWRDEIDNYVAAHCLVFREDASNQQADALRNRIRLRVIPQIEKEIGREIRKPISRAAHIAAEEEALLDAMIPAELVSEATLSVKQMRALPVALQRRAIAKWLRFCDVVDVRFSVVEQVRALLEAITGPAKTNLRGSRHARRRAGRLFIEG